MQPFEHCGALPSFFVTFVKNCLYQSVASQVPCEQTPNILGSRNKIFCQLFCFVLSTFVFLLIFHSYKYKVILIWLFLKEINLALDPCCRNSFFFLCSYCMSSDKWEKISSYLLCLLAKILAFPKETIIWEGKENYISNLLQNKVSLRGTQKFCKWI